MENNNRSEVARLLNEIRLQCESAHRGLHAFAAGRARHDFIQASMDDLGEIQTRLALHVGEDESWRRVGAIYQAVGDAP